MYAQLSHLCYRQVGSLAHILVLYLLGPGDFNSQIFFPHRGALSPWAILGNILKPPGAQTQSVPGAGTVRPRCSRYGGSNVRVPTPGSMCGTTRCHEVGRSCPSAGCRSFPRHPPAVAQTPAPSLQPPCRSSRVVFVWWGTVASRCGAAGQCHGRVPST